ncbi:MAG: hypothetical protein JJV97_00650 [SAR324 cluster bacterium]|nr:hypothetical protein [SAR324 cluster bacterium]
MMYQPICNRLKNILFLKKSVNETCQRYILAIRKALAVIILSIIIFSDKINGQDKKEARSNISPFPIITELQDDKHNKQATLKIFNKLVEVYDINGDKQGSAGYYHDKGWLFLYLVDASEQKLIVGRSRHRLIYDKSGNWLGSYAGSAIYMHFFDTKAKYLGRAKCIFNHEACGTAGAAYMLGLFSDGDGS